MKQVAVDDDTAILPQDIITNILKRLPVKSLIRFRCVCKNWKNLFKTASFIADHLHHTGSQTSSLLLGGANPIVPAYLGFVDQKMQVFEAQSAPLIGSLLGVNTIGSSHGLVCLQRNEASIFVWNPATREMGFGFCPLVNDYKIVRMRVSSNNERSIRMEESPVCAKLVNQVQLYSLSTRTWNAIEFGNLDCVYLISNSFPANGAIFWFGFMLNLGQEDENYVQLIVSFDIAIEVFTLIPLPTSVPKSLFNRLTVHENNLAMLSHTFSGNYESSLIDLWVMEEGAGASGGRWNWTKKYSVSPYPCILVPWTIWRNEIVCNFVPTWETERERRNNEQNIVMVNLTTNEFKTVAIPRKRNGYVIFNYVESLVPVGNNHIEEL
ncbi:F-box protein CPR1-like [Prosopis cineraria]|uniref:F-box protein CPR1-like n=1 Tax=Prosopis cineraria TaxID=364024 RepID=UPI00240F02CC|nr:F-box protein CPR1-like [Prosopis cineraria]